jgi:hypothetical protein
MLDTFQFVIISYNVYNNVISDWRNPNLDVPPMYVHPLPCLRMAWLRITQVFLGEIMFCYPF